MSDIETYAKNELEVDPRLLEALVCPVTRRPLTYDKLAQELISPTVGLAFPIRSGVPIMLVDQARKFDPVKA
ncbi:MAG: Trm112 family protein [Asticcacaulis sp.]|nr:Trm112 family protein [Asticcacaulis sp.]